MNAQVWLLSLSCLCFVAGFFSSLVDLRTHGVRHTRFHVGMNALGFLLQCGFLTLRGKEIHHCPFTTPYEMLVFVAWAVMLIYILSGSALRVSLLGFFTAPLVLTLQGSALFLDKSVRIVKITPLLEWHAAVSLLSYGAFALAAVAGVMYLVQDHLLKKQDLGELFLNLPPLFALGQAIKRILLIGVALCTAGVVSAFFLPEQTASAKLWVTIAIWIAYAALLFLIVFRAMSPRSSAIAAALLFLVPLISLSFLHTSR